MLMSSVIRQPRTLFSSIQRIKPVSLSRLSLKALIDIDFDSEPGIALAVASGVPTQSPAAARDTLLDTYYDCSDYDAYGNPDKGVGKAWATAYHSTQGINFETKAVGYAVGSGSFLMGTVVAALPGISYAIASGNVYLIPNTSSWIKWSKIGNVNFTIDKSNEAGECPMPWSGWTYGAMKHLNSIVVYGQNGVAILKSTGVLWGHQKLLKIGILSKNAFCGNERVHYFIARDYSLYKLSDGLQNLDYRKHLSVLNSKTVMHYDESSGIVYVSDGTYGFVYADGLGSGPINLSGLGWKNGVFYSVAPSAIVTPPMNCQSDVVDFGSRKVKTMSHVDFGISVTGSLMVAVDYRYRVNESWYTSPWVKADSNGVAHLTVSGVDFRFNWKLLAWEYVEIPEIRVFGP